MVFFQQIGWCFHHVPTFASSEPTQRSETIHGKFRNDLLLVTLAKPPHQCHVSDQPCGPMTLGAWHSPISVLLFSTNVLFQGLSSCQFRQVPWTAVMQPASRLPSPWPCRIRVRSQHQQNGKRPQSRLCCCAVFAEIRQAPAQSMSKKNRHRDESKCLDSNSPCAQ